jgi:Sel1 repeat
MKNSLFKTYMMGALVALSCSTLSAQTLNDASVAFDNAKYNDAADILRKLNPQTPKAKAFLCQLYADKLISPNREESSAVCEEAVVAKDPVAIYIYALAYLNGNPDIQITANPTKGIGFMAVDVIDLDFAPAYDFFCSKYLREGDVNTAINFCKVAASKGMRKSLYAMGMLSSEGKGVIQDYKRANNLMLASAALNYTPAYMYLGQVSRDGLNGNPKDLKQAYAWYSLAAAADSNNTSAAQARDNLKLSGDDVIAAQKLATVWKAKTPKLIDYHKAN